MVNIRCEGLEAFIDTERGIISSVKIGEHTVCNDNCPLFIIRFRDKEGNKFYINSTEAQKKEFLENSFNFSSFPHSFSDVSVQVNARINDSIEWRIDVLSVPSDYAIEWIEFPKITLPRLIENDSLGGKILFPYNEGILVSNEKEFIRYDLEFPMSGATLTFPNMVSSQFIAYLFEDIGLYIGAHDKKRSFKCVDFYPYEEKIAIQMRLYSGVDYGQSFKSDFPIVWRTCGKDWKSAAEIYRKWFGENLPPRVVPISENKTLPEWYENSPLVVTYPVRGIHDMDEMKPNELFPYTNALPVLNMIKEKTSSRIMSLLMHWEGTAPWAPPYVWPPFGGEELFNEFRDKLHENGDLLGVYCSGFGYTLRSTLIESYNLEEKIRADGVLQGVCHSPENKPELGITCCPYQRYGYDICPSSEVGKKILNEAYSPLFNSGVDYAQILDQNHGGGQYLCYARDHGHPPMPGEWMTSNMQQLLTSWNNKAPDMIFGCESASAEPFIGNLLMSDNRYELNYRYGVAVPLYAYIYHEYVRNFMGNQVGCPFETTYDSLRYRLGYSFSIGDLMTLTLMPSGKLMTHWGTRDFENCPDMDLTLEFIKNMTSFYNGEGKKYLYSGKMSQQDEFTCEDFTMPMYEKKRILPRLLHSTWEDGDKTAYIVVNPENEDVDFSIGKDKYTVSPLDAILIIK